MATVEEQEQLKQRSELGKAAEAAQKLAHLERISSRLQEVDDPRTYHPLDGRPLRARAWEEQPTTRAILAAKDEAPPNVDTILAAMTRLHRSELVQEAGCWALKELVRLDESPGSPTGRQAEILQKGGLDVAMLALSQHTKSYCVQYRALQLVVGLAVRGVDDWVPHTARTAAYVDPAVRKAIRLAGGVRIGRDALFVHSLGRVQDLGDGRDARYIRSEVQEWAWRLMVLCGEEDRYTGAELASYYPATFDDLPEPELQRKSKWMGKIVRDAIRDKKGLGFDVVKCKKIWDRYDEDKSGSMDLEELNRVIKAMRKSSGDKELPFMTKEQFAEVDADGSGELEFQEFCDWYTKRDSTTASIETLFRSLDSDGSGNLDYEEFCVAMERLGLGVSGYLRIYHCRHIHLLARGRASPDTALARDTCCYYGGEVLLNYDRVRVRLLARCLQLNGEEIKELISVLDSDGDGEISIEEFMVVVDAPE